MVSPTDMSLPGHLFYVLKSFSSKYCGETDAGKTILVPDILGSLGRSRQGKR